MRRGLLQLAGQLPQLGGVLQRAEVGCLCAQTLGSLAGALLDDPLDEPLVHAGLHRLAGAGLVEAYQQRLALDLAADIREPFGAAQLLQVAPQHHDSLGVQHHAARTPALAPAHCHSHLVQVKVAQLNIAGLLGAQAGMGGELLYSLGIVPFPGAGTHPVEVESMRVLACGLSLLGLVGVLVACDSEATRLATAVVKQTTVGSPPTIPPTPAPREPIAPPLAPLPDPAPLPDLTPPADASPDPAAATFATYRAWMEEARTLHPYPESVEAMWAVMICESSGNAAVVAAGHHGLFQYSPETWGGSWNPYRDQSILEPRAQIFATAKAWQDGYQTWWGCYGQS